VHLKGHSFREAAAILRSRWKVNITDQQLSTLLRDLPRRLPMRPVQVAEAALRSTPSVDDSAAAVINGETTDVRRNVQRILEASIEALPVEERVLLKLRFWEDASIADAARILGVQQRPLYRRIEKLLTVLRERLHSQGVSVEQIRELTGGTAR